MSNKLLILLSELLFHALFLPEMKTFSKLTSHQWVPPGKRSLLGPELCILASQAGEPATAIHTQGVVLGLGILFLSGEPARLGEVMRAERLEGHAYQIVSVDLEQ